MIQKRNIALYIVLSIVTCGFFSIYWFITLTDDTNTVSNSQTPTGVTAFLLSLVTCGLYSLYWSYKQGEKIDAANNARGINSSNTGLIYLILSVFGFGIIAYALNQDSLNKLA